MGDRILSDPRPSPWLISFEGGAIAENVRGSSVRDQMENDKRELGLRIDNLSGSCLSPPRINNNITAASPPRPNATTIIPIDSFYALAARAYQESIRFPDSPPPSVWAPGDPLHPYYTQILSAFFVNFYEQLQLQQHQHQGAPTRMTKDAFYAEWLKHSRSVLDNIRADWGKQARGFGAGSATATTTIAIKTTANNTVHRPAANVALQQTMLQPVAPPDEGWRRGEPLHPYYVLMLGRFEDQLRSLLEAEFGGSVVFEERALQAGIFEFEVIIMREYRKMWIEMFGL
ncbi:conserved hypothetical protein [Histoplasma capsulatum var. duboisii H88]|nr:conserved hypothetical protein [Histoplasma capsulatum var. duboisii H88]